MVQLNSRGEIIDVNQADQFQALKRILSTLFATEVGQVVRCRECGCPVVHMEHLTMDKAKALETEVRALLDIPATLADEEDI